MTLYTFKAIATVLSQLLFAGLCLAQHLTFTMHFNLQGGRPQILKANHTAHTQQVFIERIEGWRRLHKVPALARILPSELSLTFTQQRTSSCWYSHSLAITKHGYIMSTQGDGELCAGPLRVTWQWDQWLPQAQGAFPLPVAPWTLFYGLLGPSKLPLIAFVQSWLPHWAPQGKELASLYHIPSSSSTEPEYPRYLVNGCW